MCFHPLYHGAVLFPLDNVRLSPETATPWKILIRFAFNMHQNCFILFWLNVVLPLKLLELEWSWKKGEFQIYFFHPMLNIMKWFYAQQPGTQNSNPKCPALEKLRLQVPGTSHANSKCSVLLKLRFQVPGTWNASPKCLAFPKLRLPQCRVLDA